MNYRHIYHAGNFSDVFKHVVLVALIQALLRKEKPFCYLDTHSGIGYYDLLSQEAQKSQEFQAGILQLWKNNEKKPQLIEDYLAIVRNLNPDLTKLRSYPGSPTIVSNLLRATDRMVLNELHAQDYARLKQNFFHDRRVAVHQQDAYHALKAFLPPLERRGVVLIDPAYEQPDEFKQLIAGMKNALLRWETGVYAIWYPIKDKYAHQQFLRSLAKCSEKILIAELNIYPCDVKSRLNGNGVAIINPPWQLDQTLKTALPWLWSVLSPNKQGEHLLYWL
jgi:23S rRNA (adenine2030-N6)-methyltransferase